MSNAGAQSSRYWSTRRRLARQVCAGLAQYTSGLVLSDGEIIGAYSGTCAYEAQNSGTTSGSGPPSNVEPPLTWSDGVVTFVKVQTLELIRTLYGGDI